jgi:hypothetical protein
MKVEVRESDGAIWDYNFTICKSRNNFVSSFISLSLSLYQVRQDGDRETHYKFVTKVNFLHEHTSRDGNSEWEMISLTWMQETAANEFKWWWHDIASQLLKDARTGYKIEFYIDESNGSLVKSCWQYRYPFCYIWCALIGY